MQFRTCQLFVGFSRRDDNPGRAFHNFGVSNPEIAKLYVLQKHRSTGLMALKLWFARSGYYLSRLSQHIYYIYSYNLPMAKNDNPVSFLQIAFSFVCILLLQERRRNGFLSELSAFFAALSRSSFSAFGSDRFPPWVLSSSPFHRDLRSPENGASNPD